MDALSISASVVGLITFAGSALGKGYRIVHSLRDSGRNVTNLLTGLSILTGILVAIKAQEEVRYQQTASTSVDELSKLLSSTLLECRKTVEAVSEILDKLDKSRALVRAARLHTMQPVLENLLEEIDRHKQVLILCLGVDARRSKDNIITSQEAIFGQIRDIRSDMEKERVSAQEQLTRDNRQALFRWLTPRCEERHDAALRLLVPGTGDWVLAHSVFASWSNGDTQALCLMGIPGSGKTVLMSRLIHYLKQSSKVVSQAATVAYFYCAYNESSGNELVQIICSLAGQVMRDTSNPEKGPAMQLYKECDDGTRLPNTDKALDLLVALSNQIETVYVLIDALDEAGDKFLLLETMMVLMSRSKSFKFLVSYRSGDYDIGQFLEDFPRIVLTSDCVRDDINLYIKRRIERGPPRLKRIDSNLLTDKLSHKAEGMFLWVSCQMDQLARPNRYKNIEDSLRLLPPDLFATYARILANIDANNRVTAARALMWLAYTADPIKLVELAEAIAIEDSSSSVGNLQKFDDPEDILQICGSLLRYSETTGNVDLAHHSVYEFLNSTQDRNDIPAIFRMDKESSLVALCRLTLMFLNFRDFSPSRMQTPLKSKSLLSGGPETFWNTKSSFLAYAIRHWWKLLPTTYQGLHSIWPVLSAFFDDRTGNFATTILFLGHSEGAYQYPKSMTPAHFCAMHGLAVVLDLLWTEKPINPDIAMEDGRTPLHIAVENSQTEAVEQLLSLGADIEAQSSEGRTPLEIALESGSEVIAKFLITSGASVVKEFVDGNTPLSVAVTNRWHSLVEFLLSQGSHVNARLSTGITSLHVAARIGADYDMLELLLKAGADRFIRDENEWTPMHFAAHWGNVETMLALLGDQPLQQSFDMRTVFNQMEWTPLHAAVQQERLHIIELLSDFVGTVSLHSTYLPYDWSQQSIEWGRGVFPQRHVSGASSFSPDLGTSSGKHLRPEKSLAAPYRPQATSNAPGLPMERIPSPLWLATAQDYLPGIRALKSGSTDSDITSCIEFALYRDKVQPLKELVSDSPKSFLSLLEVSNFDAADVPWHKGTTGMNLSDQQDEDQNVRSQVTVAQICRSVQWSAEHLSLVVRDLIWGNQTKTLRLLLEQNLPRTQEPAMAGEKLQFVNDAMVHAVSCTRMEAINMLLEFGATLKADQIAELLDRMIQENNPINIRLILEQHLPPSGDIRKARQRHQMLNDAMLHAIMYGHGEVTRALREFGADVPAAEDTHIHTKFDGKTVQCTVLHLAVYMQQWSTVSDLLKELQDANFRDEIGRSPLHYAAFECTDKASINLLCDHGLEVNCQDDRGWTPLHVACHYGNEQAASWLLEAGAKVDVVDREGRNAMHHWAFFKSTIDILLKMYGASVEVHDNYGLAPVELALINSFKQLKDGHTPESILSRYPDLISRRIGPLGQTALHFAAKAGLPTASLDSLISEFRMHAYMEAEDVNGMTPLQVATGTTQRYFINRGFYVYDKTRFAVQLAKLAGIGKVVMVGAKEEGLKLFGTTDILDRHGSEEEVLKRICAAFGDSLIYAFDAVNDPEGPIMGLNTLSIGKKGNTGRIWGCALFEEE